jgi:hypothetical protein
LIILKPFLMDKIKNIPKLIITNLGIVSLKKTTNKVKIEPAPDEWDRLFNVDFYIKIKEKYIGLQIKPVNDGIQLPEIFKEKNLQAKTHLKFTEVFGGKVFYVFSTKINGKKEIVNREIINEIKAEVEKLKKL